MPDNAQLLTQRLTALRSVPGLDARIVDRLAGVLAGPDDWACFRITPLAFAQEHGELQAFVGQLSQGIDLARPGQASPGRSGSRPA
jgi:hypothetical protein